MTTARLWTLVPVIALFAGAASSADLKPSVIRFGADVGKMSHRLAGRCATIRVRRIDPPFLDHVRRRQMQIDCEGFAFAGAPRHAEFVIRDDRLEMVWIMLRPEEGAVLEAAMTRSWGTPKARGRIYLQYPKARAALRLDKHEVLFYASSLASEVEGWFREADGA